MKILLLGKNGQLGYALQEALAPLGELIALGRSECDMTDLNAVAQAVQTHQPNVIVNAAAYTAVDKAETDQVNCYLANAAAPSILAGEAKKLAHYWFTIRRTMCLMALKLPPTSQATRLTPLIITVTAS
jgi:dTDP-4-dehydrorhamnose reductase